MKTITALLAAGTILFLASCKSEQKKSEDIITHKIVKIEPQAPIRMQDDMRQTKCEVNGKTITCEVVRRADESLGMVKDEIGQEFIDNRITLTVTRADSTVILKHTYTKHDFDAHLTDGYRQGGILEGLVFDRVEGDTILFAASVSLPQTDEYIPLTISLTQNGATKVARDTRMDTCAEDE